MRRFRWLTMSVRGLALLLAAALFAAACGSSDDDAADDGGTATSETAEDTSSEDTSSEDADADDTGSEDAGSGSTGEFPVTIESAGGTWTLEAAPERIVSLSPAATELLFGIGAGDQVVAVDEFSTYPPEAPTTDLSGWDPNIEAITAYEPDLVVIVNDANDLIAGLTELEIPVLVNPAPVDIEGGYAGIAELGVATGQIDGAARLVSEMQSDFDAAFAAAPETSVRVYHELDETFFSASSNGFIGSIYTELGAENIADEADADGTGFPQLTEEYIIEVDPELIVITDQVTYTADDVAARPGWEQVSAVQNGNIVVVNADISSRWGPRLPEFVTAVAEAMAAVPAG